MKRVCGCVMAAVWLAFNISCGGASDSAPPAAAIAAPTITGQPQDQTVSQGATATFSVQATGNPAPTFQWYHGDGSIISGATLASYTTPPITSSDDGSTFYVVAKNSEGSATSDKATLHMKLPDPPQITGITPLTTQATLYNRFELTADVVSNSRIPSTTGRFTYSASSLPPAGRQKTSMDSTSRIIRRIQPAVR